MEILVCDDVKEEADSLASMLGEAGFDIRTIIFTRTQEALDYVRGGAAVDCCFLDIILPDMNGMELAEKLRQGRFSGEIVFLTSSNDFAHQSYQVRAFDYLLKPPTREKVINILHALENERKNTDQKGLTVKIRGHSVFILYRNISHAEIVSHTVYIRLINGDEIKVYSTFAEIAPRLLSDKRFLQCHRSYIVNVYDIESVAEKQVVMRNGAKIPVSRRFSQIREEMIERMFAVDTQTGVRNGSGE